MKLGPRDASVASVMEKEALAKHRKALMLFGTYHLFHMSGVRASAVSMYEKDYPDVTYVISTFFMDSPGSDRPVRKVAVPFDCTGQGYLSWGPGFWPFLSTFDPNR